MSHLCGWLPASVADPAANVIAAMGRAARAHDGQEWFSSASAGIAVGILDLAQPAGEEWDSAPVVSRDGRHWLWFAGEAFNTAALGRDYSPDATRSLEFRQKLLAAWQEAGVAAVRRLDGQYLVVIWDAVEELLNVVNDRFGTLPLYWTRSAEGFAFAGSVRAVLAAPGVSAAPDLEAIREAVTFGGFRVGDRTSVERVKMLPMASILTVARGGSPVIGRYWRWSDIPAALPRPMAELIESAHELWQRAISRRLAGAKRPGQTLSGGLDSRAILAEAAPLAPRWTAITYGVPDCDDAHYAQRAAMESRVTWLFHPLYSGQDPDWLERRTRLIQQTDGLIQLGDLMHLESADLQTALMDVNLSGYIGDAACGPAFDRVETAEGVATKMPFYGADLSWPWPKAVEWARTAVAALGPAPARFALYEHKIAQATNHLFHAPTTWFRVRRPFLDYELFDFFNGQPTRVRRELYWRMLRAKYPRHFALIPNHATRIPVLSPHWQVQLARVRRGVWRRLQPRMRRFGIPARPIIRSYMADHEHWSQPRARSRIEATVLRRESLVCEVFGRQRVEAILRKWFEHDAAPCQLIGALYVYEAYHRDLPNHLRSARPGLDDGRTLELTPRGANHLASSGGREI